MKLPRLTLGSKFGLAMSVPLMCVAVAFGYLEMTRARENARILERDHGRSFLARFAKQIAYDVAVEDRVVLAETLAEVQLDQPEMRGIRVFGQAREALVSWTRNDFSFDQTEDSTPSLVWLTQEVVTEEALGHIDLVVGLDRVQASLRSHWRTIAAQVALTLAVLALVSLALGHRLSGSIRDLVGVSREFVGGGSDRRAREGLDEVGELGRAFNQMLDHALEQEVALRSSRDHALNAADAAEQAGLVKERFLANMSHEIRTPLTAILGFSEGLSESSLEESERLEFAKTIRASGQHLLSVVDDILDFSKSEAGEIVVESLPLRLPRLVHEVSLLMRGQAEAKGLSLECHWTGLVPETITTDEMRLKQILVNLLSNAVKFTATGSVTLSISCETHDDQGGVARFDVIDTGIGLSDEQLSGLLQPFKQADASTTRRFGGTGLGLVLSRRLARLLGGDIAVSTRPSQGSTFSVTVTTGDLNGVRWIAPSSEARPSEGARPVDPPAASLNGLEILLAEDSEANQRLIRYVLVKAGADVTVVENGELAVAAVVAADEQGCSFDVVLMDMHMPVLDGCAATSQLREQGYSLPIIALTANALPADRDRCLESGMDAFQTKPIDREQLVASILALGAPEGRPV